MGQSIKGIKALLQSIDSIEALDAHEWNQDTRKGVQQALLSRRKQLLKAQALVDKYETMSVYENEILSQDAQAVICGIDEVGRGPLAGPVVACAVILNAGHAYYGLDDSKKVSSAKRLELKTALEQHATYAYGLATPEEIDDLNIYQATQVAMMRAIEALPKQPTHLLIDAMELPLDIAQTAIIKGDAKSVSIAAASIMAKEYRDAYMRELSAEYPGYDFEHNVGYGTKAHLAGIDKLGVIPEHRKTFEPIKSLTTKND
ncbi:ribonuclease HII [Staphylococcus simulans]|uniref:ribonuclease HII n=1 Tax=Staphylococcus simulans TaxID=1286 RepID=UPI000D03CB59|nr:ribonuclease HII [Staphylococcus simulans]